jgi:two-component system, OmpR family, copper resistance phosphate regulon response regulator CusR
MTTEKYRVLLVEDEDKTASSLKQGLEEHGYEVHVASNGLKGLEKFRSANYDLVISDIIMPELNGIELCAKIREAGVDTPLLLITALGMTQDKVTGFEAGADDYLVKPFAFEEFIMRVKALIKRSKGNENKAQSLRYEDIEIDMDTHRLTRSGKYIELTPKEFALMVYLIKNKEKVVTRKEIAEKVWDIKFDTGTNVIDVYVSYLRKKIDKDFPLKLIHTKVGVGYMLHREQVM